MSEPKTPPVSIECWCDARIDNPTAEQTETFMRFHDITCPEADFDEDQP